MIQWKSEYRMEKVPCDGLPKLRLRSVSSDTLVIGRPHILTDQKQHIEREEQSP